MNIAELFVRVTADVAGLERGMSRAQRAMQQAGDTMVGLGRTMSLTLTVPLAAFGAAAVVNATKIDSLSRALEAVSDVPIGPQLERLREIARLPGLSFEEAVQGSVNLQAVGFAAEQSERILRAFGNAVASTGGGAAELGRITTQLTQMASAGRVLTADLRPIIQTSPLVAAALQEAFGTISAEEIQELGLSSEEFISRLTAQLETLPTVAAGPKVAFEGLADSFTQASAAVGQQLLPVVLAVTTALSKMLELVTGLDPVVLNLAIGFGAAAAALGPVLLAVGTLVKLMPVLQASMALLVGVGGPVLLGVAAFGALVAAGLALVQNWQVIKYEAGQMTEAVTGFFRDMYEKVVGHSYVPDMVEGISREFTRMGGIFDDAGRAIVDWTMGSGEAFSAFVEKTIADLGRLLVKMALVQALTAAFSGATGGFGGFIAGALGVAGGGAQAAPAALGGSFNIIDALGPIPKPMSPHEAETHVFYRTLIQAVTASNATRV